MSHRLAAVLHPKPIPITTFFNRQWWLSTLLVLAAMTVMIRLGFWQLNRLDQRRARNAEITYQLSLPPISLNDDHPLPADLSTLTLRQGTAYGKFDFSRQMALTQQSWMGSPGIHLITPLLIEGSNQAVLVNRGWIPYAESPPEKWSQFNQTDSVPVTGFIQLSQELPQARTGANRQMENTEFAPQIEWYRVDIKAMQAQLPYEILPIFIWQLPTGDNSLPYRAEPEFDLSEGSHMGYAIQWYTFALVLGLGYISYVGKHIKKVAKESQ